MTVALGSTDYVKGVPLKAKNVGKLKLLRTGRKKEKIKKKIDSIEAGTFSSFS